MPTMFFIEPCDLPRWSPWSAWLRQDRGEAGCPWTPRHPLKRDHDRPQLEGTCTKRPCCRREERPAAAAGFRQAVSVTGYRPEEVSVRLSQDGVVTVSACRRRRSADGFSHSRMVRRVSLPKHVQADKLTSRLTPEGELVLEAPPRLRNKIMLVPVTCEAPTNDGGGSGKAEKSEEIEQRTDKNQKDIGSENKTEDVHEEASREFDQDCKMTTAGHEVPVNVSEDDSAQACASQDDKEFERQEKSDDGDDRTAASTHEADEAAAEANDATEVIDIEVEADSQVTGPPSPAAVSSEEPASCRAPLQRTPEVLSDPPALLASVDVSAFSPEEVSVRVSGRQLSVEAVHEETAGDGGSCQLRLARRLTLPEGVDPDLVTSRLTSAGRLLLEVASAQHAASA